MTDQEINLAVAKKLGLGPKESMAFGRRFVGGLKNYCGSIEAAWELVEHLAKKGFCLQVNIKTTEGVGCKIGDLQRELVYAQADTAPRALCLAFLKLS